MSRLSSLASIALATCMAAVAWAPAIAQVIQPERGDPLRIELLDAARPTFVADTAGPIEFQVRRLNVLDDWAFGDVYLTRPGGAAIDWSRTKYAEDHAQGMFDPGGSFFLMRKCNGVWSVIDYSTGPTDVVWDGWRQEHSLHGALFER